MEALERQRRAFVAKFGREPGPSDPLFFDPEADTPQQLTEGYVAKATLDTMRKAGTRPELVYAYQKTGLIVSKAGYENMTPEDRAEYDAAIDEYFRLEKEGKGRPAG